MGTEQASLSAAIKKNIDDVRKKKELSQHELLLKAGIAKSTFYRNMKHPENFTIKEIGTLAEALDHTLLDLFVTDQP